MKKLNNAFRMAAIIATLPIMVVSGLQQSPDTCLHGKSTPVLPVVVPPKEATAINHPDTGFPGMLNARIIIINY